MRHSRMCGSLPSRAGSMLAAVAEPASLDCPISSKMSVLGVGLGLGVEMTPLIATKVARARLRIPIEVMSCQQPLVFALLFVPQSCAAASPSSVLPGLVFLLCAHRGLPRNYPAFVTRQR